MPGYRWSCHICGASNPPELECCHACNFAATATGREIETARASLLPPSRPEFPESRAAAERTEITSPLSSSALPELAGIGRPRKFLGYFGVGLAGFGWLVFQWTLSLAGTLVGVALFVVGVLIFVAVAAGEPKSVERRRPGPLSSKTRQPRAAKRE